MAKLKTEQFFKREHGIDFRYDINVNAQGEFYTYLPGNIVDMLEGASIILPVSRKRGGHKKGFLLFNSLSELSTFIEDLFKDFFSTTVVSESIILRYCIQTQCSYCLDENGEVVPNGNYGVKDASGHCSWKQGTISTHAAQPTPYGFQVFVKPLVKRILKYKSGTLKTEYSNICFAGPKYFEDGEFGLGYYGKWLDGICAISPIGKQKEMPYTEKMAEFFVGMIKSICNLNERIKDFLEPDLLQLMADNGQKLLG